MLKVVTNSTKLETNTHHCYGLMISQKLSSLIKEIEMQWSTLMPRLFTLTTGHSDSIRVLRCCSLRTAGCLHATKSKPCFIYQLIEHSYSFKACPVRMINWSDTCVVSPMQLRSLLGEWLNSVCVFLLHLFSRGKIWGVGLSRASGKTLLPTHQSSGAVASSVSTFGTWMSFLLVIRVYVLLQVVLCFTGSCKTSITNLIWRYIKNNKCNVI